MLLRFHNLVRSVVTAIFIAGALCHVAAEKPADSRTIIYNPGSEAPALDRSAAKLFSDKYRVVDIKPSREFRRAHVKGFEIYLRSDPRPRRETNTPAKASIGYVVTAEGLVKDLRVLESTDKRVAAVLIGQILQRRFVAAEYRGAAVPSLEHTEASFLASEDKGDSLFKDGLGIMGSRDR